MKRLVRFLFRTLTSLVIAAGIFAIACYFLQNYKVKDLTQSNPMLDEPVVVESVSFDRYAYQHIDEESQVTYDQIYNCITEYKEKVTVTTKSSDVLQRAYEAVMADYGNLFWVSGYKYNTYTSDGTVVSIEFSPKYTMSKDQRDVYQASVDATADEWLAGISENASDFDKALYVFETLIENVDYNTDSEENQNILSVFLYRSTVCQGYADSAWYLLDKLGIKSTIITGTANGESHAWNLVYIDGAYYYMDVTWGNSKYMDGNNDTAKRVNYAYFAMTTEEISQNHVITVGFEVPECLSNADNYYVHEGLYYDWFGVDSIGNRLSQSYESGEAEISLKFSNSDLYSQVINYFIDENHLSDYCRGLNSVYYLLDENANVLTIQWTKGE
ncbi:transglutaminase domain-containing protein [Pseudobutyrivibrio xylanivorans]|uniref:Transglutaminase-like superfamily protein n=1 Tax=Pseudobutyrivibrio xylanivorans TaxID=185007 RepID=A0A1G5S508_PSEXY|nr:transglutaminase domain-containing protein [Pseudobutyrivibrio xylanivorans]SCZ80841.1 Transglutaminase-like superfamily protein [Pseudobutyrivibrio xylanivorans]